MLLLKVVLQKTLQNKYANLSENVCLLHLNEKYLSPDLMLPTWIEHIFLEIHFPNYIKKITKDKPLQMKITENRPTPMSSDSDILKTP